MKTASEIENLKYWDEFYKNNMIDEESTFCTFVKSNVPSKEFTVLDVGCGSGRDTRSFAKNGYQIVGIDRSCEVIKNNNLLVKGNKLIHFEYIDIGLEDDFLKFLVLKKSNIDSPLLVYCRFFLHSINEETEYILLNSLNQVLKSGDRVAFEFRTLEDATLNKVFGNHYRRFINTDELLNILENQFSFKIDYFHKGQGISIYNEENPFLARLLLTKI